MKINSLKINGYGNIENKEIKLKEKINIIYGKNESGKSTFLNFITSILYGISKNKRGKEISNFEKYIPWNTEEFSGKLSYELDNGKKIEIFRDFKKRNPKIYNENSEEISKEFNIDKLKGNEFFYEQTKIDEELFLNTTAVMQKEVELEEKSQNSIIQKISNLSTTGNDNISYKKSIEKLNKKQLSEIGTEKSQERPINKIQNKIKILKEEKKELEEFIYKRYEIEDEDKKTEINIKKNKKEIELLNEIKSIIENKKIKNEKIKIQNEILEKNILRIDELKKENTEFIKTTKISNNKEINNKKYLLIFFIILLLNISTIIFIKNNIAKYIFASLFIGLIIFYFIEYKKIKNNNLKYKEKVEKEINAELLKKKNEIEILERNNEENKKEILREKNEVLNYEVDEKNKLLKKYNEILSEEEINYITESNKLNLEEKEKQLTDIIIKKHKIEIEKENINIKLEKLVLIEEELNKLNEELDILNNKNKSINLAKVILEKAYKKMKEEVTPKFTEGLTNTIREISNNKYNKIKFNSENGLIVEKQTGEYIKANLLSIGTIDQLYLALRLTILNEMSKEKLPIILDEAFAFYDEKRLKNILKYLYEKIDNQIIILTCTNRERSILEEMGTEYNLIEL